MKNEQVLKERKESLEFWESFMGDELCIDTETLLALRPKPLNSKEKDEIDIPS